MDYQPSNALTEVLRRLFQRRIGDAWYAVLGDRLEAGARTDVPGKPGWVYVMFLNGGDANGNVAYTSPTMVRAGGVAFPNVPGTGLWIGYGYDGDLCVKAAHNKSLDAMGINTQVLNPLNQQSKFVYPWQNTYGLALAVGNSTTPSTLITIKKIRHYTGGNLLQPFDTPLQADKIDLASYIPAADTHCYAMVWLDTYTNAASVTTSVTQALSSPLGDSDLQECVVRSASSRPPDAVMFKAFYLSNAQGSITQSDLDVDVRQWLDMPNVLGFPNVLTTLERVRANYTLVTGPFTTSGVGDLDTSETGAQHIIVHKNNLNATTAPTINDDSGDGYSVESVWFNKTTGILYVASDVTVGAAVWTPVAGSGAAPSSATYLVQTANAGLPNAQAMGALGTGLVKNATATGVQTIAIAGTDYTSPAGAENLSNKAITASTVNSTPIGGTTPSTGAFTSLSALVTDAATNTTTNVLTIGHDTSGTPTTSYGTGLLFQGESSTTSARDMGRVRTVWTTATDASRVANMILSANNASGETDMLTVSPTAVSVAAFLDMPALAAAAGAIRFRAGGTTHNQFYHDGTTFLMLNSTGQMQFRNAANAEVNFFTNNVAKLRIDGSGNVSLANTSISPTVQLGVTNTSALTNTLLNIMTINHNTSGTPAASFGETVAFNLQSSTTANRAAGAIDVLWDTATDASRASAMVLNVYSVTTKQPFIKAIADASGIKIGLNGANPVARSTYGAPTGVLTRTTFDPSTVTLSQLAERVAAMITDLKSRGDFG